MEAKKIGIPVQPPSGQCQDSKCPFHGSLKLHGRTFTGMVLATRSAKTATVGWERRYYVPKYERYERRYTKLHVHNPTCINAQQGDVVIIAETRPLSKTKHFVVVQKSKPTSIKVAGEEELPEKEKQKQVKEKKTTETKEKKKRKGEQ
ncbi:30S ribosomal protein S17 [Candidatus Woesearchaeota archaeon]|nr:30S ribosomal protein S17 [Candidatus Woesearchaeota archaeon]